MASSKLEALDERLRGIVTSADHHQKPLTTPNTPAIEPASGRPICSICALSCSTPGGLANHYRSKHIDSTHRPIVCPYEGCELRFRTEQLSREHYRNLHRFRCPDPGCQRDFPSGALLAQHEEEHTRRNSDFQLRTCPHPACGQVFPDQAALFAHYDGFHPLSIYSPGKKLPYKCPFCPKKYAMERYMAGHQRRDHSTNEAFSSEEYESQAALIRESHDSVARKGSRAVVEGLQISPSTSLAGSEPQIKCEESGVTVEKHTIYMDDEIGLLSPPLHQPTEPASQTQREKMAIGYILQPVLLSQISSNITDEEMVDDDNYPESLALDDSELPKKAPQGPRQTFDQFASDALGQRIIHWVIALLDMKHWLTVSEVLELWDAFLTPAQRVIILEQLNQINVGEDDTAVLSALHGSVLCEVIHAWARFKLLTLQLPEGLRQHTASAKGTTWAVLKYCTELEILIKEGRLTASSLGHVWPMSLREAPLDEGSITLDAPFVELLAALEVRVRCRKVHPAWMQFTNELVLKEMTRYFGDLKTEAEATKSLNLRTIDWFGKMNLL